MCIDFYNNVPLETLYFSLVRSQIEQYASLIWHTDDIGQNVHFSSRLHLKSSFR